MDLSELIKPEGIIANLRANSKKQALQELAEKAAPICGESDRDIFDTLLQRERLGSTGVGNGIAIPHGKMTSLTNLYGLFARLEKPIEFDSLDDQPVDLIFVLLAPEGAGADHLKALAKIARLLRNSDVASKLRATTDADALYALLTQPIAPVSAS
ncbi:PTS IIA-like nitrogen regulatory protein PtsN [Polycladidibacter stylochi]|uniref:PTS IIA-like nitrogen regulatory protein PtsN n=1 Tax=Polycladidibacter stylochi TaxID=1807766 RepID=UPI00083723A0|nr:PTS IIA-like nitrogen regulatory protein PtsN [Pseudovibrio stylochi]